MLNLKKKIIFIKYPKVCLVLSTSRHFKSKYRNTRCTHEISIEYRNISVYEFKLQITFWAELLTISSFLLKLGEFINKKTYNE